MKMLLITMSLCLRTLKPGGIRGVIGENIMLRRQLLVLKRGRDKSPPMLESDRIILAICVSLMSPRRTSKSAIGIAKSTLLKFHKALIKGKYSILFSNKGNRKPGRPGPSLQLIKFIVETKELNPTYDCPKIAKLASRALGRYVDEGTVRRILKKHFKPKPGGGPSWLAPIGNTPGKLFSVDLFRLESAWLRSYWIMLVMDQYSRKIIGFAVNVGSPDGGDICYMFNQIMFGKDRPTYLSSDNDPLFKYLLWKSNLEWFYKIEELKTVPFVPFSHPFVERLIGSVRREFTDWILFQSKSELMAKLCCYRDYYNKYRVHDSHGGQTPEESCGKSSLESISLSNYRWKPLCGGMYHTPMAA